MTDIFRNEPDNVDRATWARAAVDGFGVETFGGVSFSEAVIDQPTDTGDAYCMCSDLIADIMHLARSYGWDAHLLVKRATGAFDAEVEEEEQSDGGESE